MEHHIMIFIAGPSADGQRSIDTIRSMAANSGQRLRLDVIDVLDDPESTEDNKVIATPTVIKRRPPPEVRLVGDVSGPTEHDLVLSMLFGTQQ